jgi:hypothetical protein
VDRINLRIAEPQTRILRLEAKKLGIGLAELVRRIIAKHLEMRS